MQDSHEEGHNEDSGKAGSPFMGGWGPQTGRALPHLLRQPRRSSALPRHWNGSSEAEFLQGLLGSTRSRTREASNPLSLEALQPQEDGHIPCGYKAGGRTTSPYPWMTRFAISRNIDKDEFKDAYSAAAYANELGYVLNVSLTICWEMLGVKPKNSSRDESGLHELVIHPLRDWLKHKSNFYWLYSNEY